MLLTSSREVRWMDVMYVGKGTYGLWSLNLTQSAIRFTRAQNKVCISKHDQALHQAPQTSPSSSLEWTGLTNTVHGSSLSRVLALIAYVALRLAPYCPWFLKFLVLIGMDWVGKHGALEFLESCACIDCVCHTQASPHVHRSSWLATCVNWRAKELTSSRSSNSGTAWYLTEVEVEAIEVRLLYAVGSPCSLQYNNRGKDTAHGVFYLCMYLLF